MLKTLARHSAILLAVITLAACSGGGGLGNGDGNTGTDGGTGGTDGGNGGGTTQTAASLSLSASSPEIPVDADTLEEGVVITALVKDANNNTQPNVTVSFATTNGELQVTQSATADSGRATAVLTLASGNAQAGDVITVIASGGGQQDSITVTVIPANSTNDPVYRLGTLNGSTFNAGVLTISQSPLSAGGSSGLSASIVDTANGNAAFTDTTAITFSSPCISTGLAEVNPNPANSFSGSVSATYIAKGCSGSDTITARTTVQGQNLQASGNIEVLAAALGSVQYVSATPTTIGLEGSGQPEQSTVVFRVLNASAGPVANQTVNFTLNTSVGGITLTPVSGTTNNNGEVQTVVNAGSIHTSVRVTATATQNGNTATSQSEQLIISTGIPDQDSFSLSASILNVEGLNINGNTSDITIRAADRFNNPVPDGTAIAFETEGGRVEGGCTTANGDCTVVFNTQDPRPSNGRSTLLATAVGEESFIDANGDGRYSTGEPFSDLPEAFRDDDESGTFDQGLEEFLDFNSNRAYDVGDGLFTGLLCDANCSPSARTLSVRDSLVIVFSGSAPVINSADGGDISVTGGTYNGATRSFTVAPKQTMIVSFIIRDLNDQTMASGTTVALAANGDAGAVVGTDTLVTPNQTSAADSANTYSFAFTAGDDPGVSGSLELTVTSPSGLATIRTFGVVTSTP